MGFDLMEMRSYFSASQPTEFRNRSLLLRAK